MARTLRDLRPRSDIAQSPIPGEEETISPGITRQTINSRTNLGEYVGQTAALDPLDQSFVRDVNVYRTPGGEVTQFAGTGLPGGVDLSRLESFIPEGTVTPEGEYVPPVQLQMLMDDPQLAQVEADLALIKSQDPEDLDASDLKKYREAERRVEDYAFDRPQPAQLGALPTMDDVRRFEEQLIENQFGGVDPRTRNVYEEIRGLGAADYRSHYNQIWDPNSDMPALYEDLDPKVRAEFEKNVRTAEFKRIQEEIHLQNTALNRVINEATAQAKQTEKAQRDWREALNRFREQSVKTREQAQEKAIELSGKLSDAQAELTAKIDQFGEGSPEVATHRAHIQELTSALTAVRKKATETKSAGEPARTGQEGGKLKPATREIVQMAAQKFPNDRAAALKWLQDQGYDTSSKAQAKTKPEAGGELFPASS